MMHVQKNDGCSIKKKVMHVGSPEDKAA